MSSGGGCTGARESVADNTASAFSMANGERHNDCGSDDDANENSSPSDVFLNSRIDVFGFIRNPTDGCVVIVLKMPISVVSVVISHSCLCTYRSYENPVDSYFLCRVIMYNGNTSFFCSWRFICRAAYSSKKLLFLSLFFKKADAFKCLFCHF